MNRYIVIFESKQYRFKADGFHYLKETKNYGFFKDEDEKYILFAPFQSLILVNELADEFITKNKKNE